MSGLITGTIAKGPLAAVCLEGICYGFATCMFGMTIWVLSLNRGRKVNRAMIAVASVLWILPTVRIVIDITNIVTAFDDHLHDGSSGPEDFLSSFSRPLMLLNNCIFAVQTMIGDAVVIYRCYVVWQTWIVLVLPCLAWLGSFGSTIYILHSFAEGVVSGDQIVMLYSFTLAANLSATLALAYRIWSVDRGNMVLKSQISKSTLRPVLLVVIESGAIYTSLLIVALVTVTHALEVEYVLNTSIPALISIIFSVVFMRMAMVRSFRNGTRNTTATFPLSAIVFDEGPVEHHSKISGTELSSGMTFMNSSAVDGV